METQLAEEEANAAADDYRQRFDFLYRLFGSKPFVIASKADRRNKVSFALYDASMVAIDRLWDKKTDILKKRRDVSKRLKDALKDWEKYELIVGRRNTADAVKGRIQLLETILSPEKS